MCARPREGRAKMPRSEILTTVIYRSLYRTKLAADDAVAQCIRAADDVSSNCTVRSLCLSKRLYRRTIPAVGWTENRGHCAGFWCRRNVCIFSTVWAQFGAHLVVEQQLYFRNVFTEANNYCATIYGEIKVFR